MSAFLQRLFWETWAILEEASVFLLFGFVMAGVLAVLVPRRMLAKLFGTGRIRSVLWGAAIGAPLPLCSCGVLPTALSLKKQGATPGATVSFLIATPETGVDSISMSYALMDPLMTVARPVAAVATAISAGIAVNCLPAGRHGHDDPAPDDGAQPAHAEHAHAHGAHAHDACTDHARDPCEAPDACCTDEHGDDVLSPQAVAPVAAASPWRRLHGKAREVLRHAFRDLLDETSYWLVLGIVLSGLIAASLPADFFQRTVGGGLLSMLVMLLIGIPIYTCASSSTPLAAAMVMKGLNPGAALVFLLAGPATNIGSILVLMRFLGARTVAVYLASIAVVSLLAGFAVNALYTMLHIDPRASFGAATALVPAPVRVAAAVTLCLLLAWSMWRAPLPAEWRRLAAWLHIGRAIHWRRLAAGAAVLGAVSYAASGFFRIAADEIGFVLRFGAVASAPLAPGLHYRWPWPIETQRVVGTQHIRRLEYGYEARSQSVPASADAAIGEAMAGGWNTMGAADAGKTAWFQRDSGPDEPFLLTGDGNLIDLRWSLQYRVADARAFAFDIAEPDTLVRGLALSALRAQVARSTIDAVYTSARSAAEQAVIATLQRSLDDLHSGIQVLSFNLRYVHPPDEVHDAFRDVASAQEDRLRTIHRAGLFAVETVNEAKGEAAAMMEQAFAFNAQQVSLAEGNAASFLLRLGGYRASPELTRFRLQIEALEQTLPGLPKFVRPASRDMKDFDMWLLQPVAAAKGSK